MNKGSSKLRVFISHSQRNNDLVRDIARRLTDAGLEPIVDFMEIAVGSDWRKHTRKSLESANAVMVLLTPESIDSDWVMTELGYADAYNLPLIPITAGVQSEDIPEPLMSHTLVTYDQLDSAIQNLAANLSNDTIGKCEAVRENS